MNVFKNVEETIRRYEMLEKGDRVLVGVSGGPDSVFLLEALYNLKDKLGIEIPKDEIKKFLLDDVKDKVAGKLRSLGFVYITLDLMGYRTGSMNEALTMGDDK